MIPGLFQVVVQIPSGDKFPPAREALYFPVPPDYCDRVSHDTRLDPAITNALRRWIATPSNWLYPYLLTPERSALSEVLGIKVPQLNDYFRNERKRVWLPLQRKWQDRWDSLTPQQQQAQRQAHSAAIAQLTRERGAIARRMGEGTHFDASLRLARRLMAMSQELVDKVKKGEVRASKPLCKSSLSGIGLTGEYGLLALGPDSGDSGSVRQTSGSVSGSVDDAGSRGSGGANRSRARGRGKGKGAAVEGSRSHAGGSNGPEMERSTMSAAGHVGYGSSDATRELGSTRRRNSNESSGHARLGQNAGGYADSDEGESSLPRKRPRVEAKTMRGGRKSRPPRKFDDAADEDDLLDEESGGGNGDGGRPGNDDEGDDENRSLHRLMMLSSITAALDHGTSEG